MDRLTQNRERAEQIKKLTEQIHKDRQGVEPMPFYTVADAHAESKLLMGWVSRLSVMLHELISMAEGVEVITNLAGTLKNKSYGFQGVVDDIDRRMAALEYLHENRFDFRSLPDLEPEFWHILDQRLDRWLNSAMNEIARRDAEE